MTYPKTLSPLFCPTVIYVLNLYMVMSKIELNNDMGYYGPFSNYNTHTHEKEKWPICLLISMKVKVGVLQLLAQGHNIILSRSQVLF